MTRHISIFVGAAPEFDELLDIFHKFLADSFVYKLRAAAGKYKEDCQSLAIEAADRRHEKLTAELLQLEPLLEEYRHACKNFTERPPSGMFMRGIISKIIDIYGPKSPDQTKQ